MDARENIRAALAYVPAHDRDTWLRMGMAVKSELGEDGAGLWDEWSEQADSYNTADAKAVWRSIQANGKVTIGTLFHEARRHGFRPQGGARSTPPNAEELAERERKARAAALAQHEKHDAAAVKAVAVWKAGTPARADHPYLVRKQVAPVPTLREMSIEELSKAIGYPAKQGDSAYLVGRVLLVPVKADDRMSTLEMIDQDSRKTALAGGRKSGGYWAAQPMPAGDGRGLTLLIGEGVATALTAVKATGQHAFATLTKDNLRNVAQLMRQQYPRARIVVLGDLGNGECEARDAAQAVGGLLTIPDFGADRPEGATDFNDLAASRGCEAVEHAIANAKAPHLPGAQPATLNAIAGDLTSREWPEPQCLTAERGEQPYPLDALPAGIREAIAEIVGFVQCPAALAACSALSALSLAGQALANVRRVEGLEGPIGLYLLAIADSGERKTTCDGHALLPLREWEAEQAEKAKPDVAKSAAAVAAWEERRAGIRACIRESAH